MKEVITLHFGQCGVQLGNALWELYSAEHNLNCDGYINNDKDMSHIDVSAFFNRLESNRCVPRVMLIDLEPTVINEVRCGNYRRLFHPDQLINSYEDAANNFARGYYSVGRLIQKRLITRFRKELEAADKLSSIHIYHSLGGGTGSGLCPLLFEALHDNHYVKKICKLEFGIQPSPRLSSSIVEPYNSILSQHFSIDDIDASFLMDNEALYDIMSCGMSYSYVTINSINRIVSLVSSCVTAPSRYPRNELRNDFTHMINLVPYPRIHFPILSYAPFCHPSSFEHNTNTTDDITFDVFRECNSLLCANINNGTFMACSLLYRGQVSPRDIYSSLYVVKSTKKIKFVNWCPTGFKVGVIDTEIPFCITNTTPEINLSLSQSVVMMSNNSAIGGMWHRLSYNFMKLYSKKSFVHWYVTEGMEETEFTESLYNMATLAKDYEEITYDDNNKEEQQPVVQSESSKELKENNSDSKCPENVNNAENNNDNKSSSKDNSELLQSFNLIRSENIKITNKSTFDNKFEMLTSELNCLQTDDNDADKQNSNTSKKCDSIVKDDKCSKSSSIDNATLQFHECDNYQNNNKYIKQLNKVSINFDENKTNSEITEPINTEPIDINKSTKTDEFTSIQSEDQISYEIYALENERWSKKFEEIIQKEKEKNTNKLYPSIKITVECKNNYDESLKLQEYDDTKLNVFKHLTNKNHPKDLLNNNIISNDFKIKMTNNINYEQVYKINDINKQKANESLHKHYYFNNNDIDIIDNFILNKNKIKLNFMMKNNYLIDKENILLEFSDNDSSNSLTEMIHSASFKYKTAKGITNETYFTDNISTISHNDSIDGLSTWYKTAQPDKNDNIVNKISDDEDLCNLYEESSDDNIDEDKTNLLIDELVRITSELDI